MRELSGRNLMDDSLSKNLRLQSKMNGKDKEKEKEKDSKNDDMPVGRVRRSPCRKSWLLVPLAICLVILGLFLGNLIKNEMIYNINETTSTSNLFAMFQQSNPPLTQAVSTQKASTISSTT
jgi:hypothetical protein